MRAILVAAVLLLAMLAGCMGTPGSAPGRDVRARWESERSAHGPAGVPATFDLAGQPLHVTGDGQASVDSPADLIVSSSVGAQKSFAYFRDARVGDRGPGLLVVEGAALKASWPGTAKAGFSRAAVEQRVVVHFEAEPGARPIASFPEDWSEANRTYFFTEHVPMILDDMTLTGHARAVLLDAAGALAVPASVTFDASGIDWASGSHAVADGAALTLDQFMLAGDVSGGSLKPEGRAAVPAPKSVFGRDAKVALAPGSARTTASFRLTQAIGADGLLLDAHVELSPSQSDVRLARGGSEWVAVSYRERSYLGDAVLAGVSVSGTGKDLVQLPVEKPPLYIERLWQIVKDEYERSTWGALILAVPFAIASPWVLLIDAFRLIGCAFTICPDQHPYPHWMGAGEVGVFYLKVTANAEPGTYSALVEVRGENYPPVEIPLVVTIT